MNPSAPRSRRPDGPRRLPRPHLNIQVCIYPFFDGGIYINIGRGPLNRLVRVSLAVIDLRLWWTT
jgi:hypothetical protein